MLFKQNYLWPKSKKNILGFYQMIAIPGPSRILINSFPIYPKPWAKSAGISILFHIPGETFCRAAC